MSKINRCCYIYYSNLKILEVSVLEYSYLDFLRRSKRNNQRKLAAQFLGVSEKTVSNIRVKLFQRGMLGVSLGNNKLTEEVRDVMENPEEIQYNKLDFAKAEELNLNADEYLLLALMYGYVEWSESELGLVAGSGSCTKSKRKLAELINQKERNVYNILNKLEGNGYIRREENRILPVENIRQLLGSEKESKTGKVLHGEKEHFAGKF